MNIPQPCVYFVGPIGLDAGLHRESERSAALGANQRSPIAVGDQLFDSLGSGPPGGDAQRQAITSEIVISTAFKMGRVGVHPQVQQIADAREILISREFGEQGSAKFHDLQL